MKSKDPLTYCKTARKFWLIFSWSLFLHLPIASNCCLLAAALCKHNECDRDQTSEESLSWSKWEFHEATDVTFPLLELRSDHGWIMRRRWTSRRQLRTVKRLGHTPVKSTDKVLHFVEEGHKSEHCVGQRSHHLSESPWRDLGAASA